VSGKHLVVDYKPELASTANVRSLIDTPICWHGHEWLLRVDSSGSIAVPRTAGIGASVPSHAVYRMAAHMGMFEVKGQV
jgi:hypothetical protein